MSTTARTTTAVYTERPGNMWWIGGPLLAWLLYFLWELRNIGLEMFRDGTWWIFPIVVVLLLPPIAALPVSKRWYHSITLDPQTLRVGREQLAVTDLDPHSVHVALAEVDPTFAQRLATSLNVVQLPGPRPAAASGELYLLGGAWGTPMGMDSVVIADRAGRTLRIATRERRSFLTALAQVLPQFLPRY